MHKQTKGTDKSAPYLTKQEVCDFLGKSQRTVEGYVKAGRLPQQYAQGQSGPRALYERGAVEAFAKELANPAQELIPTPGLAVSKPAFVAGDQKGLAEFLAHYAAGFSTPPASVGFWADVDFAAELSGLPKRYLIAQAKAGAPWALNVGQGKRAIWRFRVPEGEVKRTRAAA